MRILIVGADGLIGQALSRALRQLGHHVIGTTRRVDRQMCGEVVFLDLAADELPQLPAADVIVLCAAIAKFADCRDAPDRAHSINVKSRVSLAKRMRKLGGRTINLSTSAVFDCKQPWAKADRRPSPRSLYGHMMAEAESGILQEDGTIVRLTKVITRNSGVLSQWIADLQNGKIVSGFEDHTFCPLSLADVIMALVAVIGQTEHGTFQVSGASDISYANAAHHLAERLGVPKTRVKSARAVDGGLPESDVTPFTSLDTSRLSTLTGFVPPDPRDVIDHVYGLRPHIDAKLNA